MSIGLEFHPTPIHPSLVPSLIINLNFDVAIRDNFSIYATIGSNYEGSVIFASTMVSPLLLDVERSIGSFVSRIYNP